jgi:hypothetical protein
MQESLKWLLILIHSPKAIIVVVSINGHDDVFGFEIHRIAKNRIIEWAGLLIALV